MSRLRFRWTSLALGCAIALGTGCGKDPKGNPVDAGGPKTSAQIPPEQAARVIAKVGDHNITLGDFAASIEHMDQFDRLRYQSPERRLELLQEMIRVELLAQEAVEKGYDKDPAAAQEIRAVLRDAVLEEAKKNAKTPADISAADARAYFEAHRAEYKDPERRRVAIVSVSTEAAATQVIDAYKKAPTPLTWGELVRSRSLEPTAKANVPPDLAGEVGFVAPPGDARGANAKVPEEVRAAVFTIGAVGEVAPTPVKSAGKFYVVRFAAKSDARARTFEDAERVIRVKLAQDDLRKKEEELLASLRKEHPVTIDEAALATVKIDLPAEGVADAGKP